MPETVPLVARTVLVKVPAALPAVKRPLALIVPPLATTDQTGVNATMLLPASRPTAVNCRVPLLARTTVFGETVTDATAPAPIDTEEVPEMVPLVARTVLVKVEATLPAVKRPVLLIVPPAATTDHVGVIATTLLNASYPTAVNCCVPPMTSAPLGGETTMFVEWLTTKECGV